MKHDNRCKLDMVIGRLEALHTLDGRSEIAHIIGASLADLRDIFADEPDGMLTEKKGEQHLCQRRTEIS